MCETMDYSTYFDPELYLSTYCDSVMEEDGDFRKLYLTGVKEFFTQRSLVGKTLLDVGTGPNISSILTASRYAVNIDLSDFTPQNLVVLKDWKEGNRNLVEETMEYEMKLMDDRRSLAERNKELRNKVRDIYRVDVTKTDIFVESKPNTEYDIITSSLCLDAAAETLSEYKDVVNHISKYLKKGGFLIVTGVIGGSFYRVGDYKFKNTYASQEEFISVYRESGFTILELKLLSSSENLKQRPDEQCYSDYQDAFVMLAQKQ